MYCNLHYETYIYCSDTNNEIEMEPMQRLYVRRKPTALSTNVNVSNSLKPPRRNITVHRQHTDLTSSILPTKWRSLDKTDVESIESFLIFIGWPRSCHSIIGSMLDAHPNVIVAHEFSVFSQLSVNTQLNNRNILYNELYRNSYMNARKGWRNSTHRQKGYSLDMDGSWQGRFKQLKVIGDKCGGDPARMYSRSKDQFKAMYKRLKANVNVPIKILQVVRNPFDMIATLALYRGSDIPEVKVNASVSNKYRNPIVLKGAAKSVLDIASAIFRMVPDVRLSPLQVHCEDLIAYPVETISHICQYLKLECSPEFLQMCADKTFKKVSESRHLVDWNLSTLPSIIERIKTFPFFHRYSFEST